ncbi:TonB-dependent receptor domain-containing protein [Pseudochryseolinea flava]|uniref:TonB-dependent receptor n=1 Tax=Pseudochryseolinea flava TaxID=2059302 RepID=A0A364Y553_9BACT|nr:TonB-dependent receptor [Pseudochryseolinea flava]RAW02128.1 TonB-dependent receptor [Pseudochryseolinea flava]
MERFYLTILIIVLPAVTTPLLAQVKGRVYDAHTKEPLVGASVSSLDGKHGTTTDVTGQFLLDTKKESIDSIKIQYIGYATYNTLVVAEGPLSIPLTAASENLQTIVVTGSREAALRTETPIAISKISSQLIDETKATSIHEVINKTPGVMMVNYNNEQHAMSIRLPFTTSSYYLYLEDGVPIRPMGVFNHNALLEMNQFTVSSIEVVKGPVSSIYGPEAVGGAINFISQRPTAVPTARIGVQLNNFGYRRIQYGGGATLGKFGFYIGGLVSDQKDSWMTYSDYDKHAQYARMEYAITPRLHLTSTISWADYDSQTAGSVDSIAFYNRAYVSTNDFTYRKSYSLRARVTLDKSWKDESKTFVTLFARDNKLGQNPAYRIRWTSGTTTATGEINSNDFQSVGALAQHVQHFNILNAKLIIGGIYDNSPVQYHSHQIDLEAKLRADGKSVEKYIFLKERPDILIGDYDATIHNAAAYGQFDFNLTEALRISTGLRYDNMSFDFVNYLDKDLGNGKAIGGKKIYARVSPKIGLTYDLGQGAGLYASYAQGFSPPDLTAIFRKRTVPADNGDLFYYNLEPATFNNVDIGGWASLLENKIYVDMSFYSMSGKNELLQIRLADNSSDYRSAGKTLHRGLEYGITFKPSAEFMFRWGGTYAIHKYKTFVLSERESDVIQNVDGKYMPTSPRWLWNTEFSYYPKRLKGFRSSIEWQHVSAWYQNQTNTIEYPGFECLNFRAGYNWKGLELYTNITNITDALYATSTSRGNGVNDKATYNPAAPRTFVFGIQYQLTGKRHL